MSHDASWPKSVVILQKLQAPQNIVEFPWFWNHFCDGKILEGLNDIEIILYYEILGIRTRKEKSKWKNAPAKSYSNVAVISTV